jgi:ABC-type multidrug transport system fused ATPase/permease subunit
MKISTKTLFLLCYQVLAVRNRRKYKVITIISILITLLDLLGVSLIGLMTIVTLGAIQQREISPLIDLFLTMMRLDNFSVQTKVGLLGILAAAILVSRTIISMFLSKKMINFLAAQCTEVSRDIFNGFFHKSILYIQQRSQQELIYLVSNGIEAIMVKILPAVSTIIVDSFLFLTLVTLLFIVEPFMAFITLLFIMFAGFLNMHYSYGKSSTLGTASAKLEVEINTRIKETLEIFDVAVVKNRVDFFVNKFSEIKQTQATIVAKIYLLPNFIKYTFELTIIFAFLLVGAFQFIFFDSIKAVTSITLFMAASTRIAPALLRIQQSLVQVKSNSTLALSTINLINDTKLNYSYKSIFTDIDFRHAEFDPIISIDKLTFGFQKSGINLINDLSIDVKAGEMVVVIGESGVGKTTLANLVLGFLPDYTISNIRISRLNPREAYKKWPGAICYVPQKSNVISGTVRENICLGYDSAYFPDEKFWQILELVELSTLVKSFRYGLDENLSEGGVNLSGGQKQKLVIARALFTNPKLLILDEPTNALDGGADDSILNNLRNLNPKLTFLIITHNYSTMKLADKILFLRKDGTVNFGDLSLVEITEKDYFKKVKS